MKKQATPVDILGRVIKVARINGIVVIFPVALLSAVIALAFGDVISALFGFAVAAAGWSEWHGAKLLQRGEDRGIGWLVRSQIYLMSLILLYAGIRLTSFDADPEIVRSNLQELSTTAGINLQQMLENMGLTVNEIVRLERTAFYSLYGSLAVVAIFYQGGLALFYRRRAEAVRTALAAGQKAV